MALGKFSGVVNFTRGEPRDLADPIEPGIYRARIKSIEEATKDLNAECPVIRFEILDDDGAVISRLLEVFHITAASNAKRDPDRKSDLAAEQRQSFITLAVACGVDVEADWDPADLAGVEIQVGIDRFERKDKSSFEKVIENGYWPGGEVVDWSPNWEERKARKDAKAEADSDDSDVKHGFGGKRN